MAIVAIIGAESSGKTSLAQALGRALPAVVVPEQLRLFVARHGRPPTRDEQPGVMAAQIAAEQRAATSPAVRVVSDSGTLMTAVYSALYFADDSLVAPAVAHHRCAYALTVWCDIDIPWQSEPGVRDGREHRERTHAIIKGLLRDADLPVLRVSGSLDARVASVLPRWG